MKIDKEFVKKLIGHEVEDIKLEPMYDSGECIGLKILVKPKRSLEFIDLKFKVLPTGAKFENFDDEHKE